MLRFIVGKNHRHRAIRLPSGYTTRAFFTHETGCNSTKNIKNVRSLIAHIFIATKKNPSRTNTKTNVCMFFFSFHDSIFPWHARALNQKPLSILLFSDINTDSTGKGSSSSLSQSNQCTPAVTQPKPMRFTKTSPTFIPVKYYVDVTLYCIYIYIPTSL